MTNQIIFCPWKNVLFRTDETSQRCMMAPRYNSSIRKSIVRMTSNRMHHFFSRKEILSLKTCVQTNILLLNIVLLGRVRIFSYFPFEWKLKDQTLFCSISLFSFKSLLTTTFFIIRTCSNRFRWNRSTQFEHNERDGSLSFIRED